MNPLILTASEMRAAEAEAVSAGVSESILMDRAGRAAAEAIWRFAGPIPALVLCGPGNNGGDGYVVARMLRERGSRVRIASLGEPKSEAAKLARSTWETGVEAFEKTEPAPLLIDALFGTGLDRPLDPFVTKRLNQLAEAARTRIAIDLPSGSATDDGTLLSPVPSFDLTVTFQTLKPSHLLQPAARYMGRLVVAEIGVRAQSRWRMISRPILRQPGPEDHKYSRGYVSVLAGEMPGAAALAAEAALGAGAGYVALAGADAGASVRKAIVQVPADFEEKLADTRVGAIVIGPGLGRGEEARDRLRMALAWGRPLVLDADALNLMAATWLAPSFAGSILTPHSGEFERLFPGLTGSKIDRALTASKASGAVIVYKGPDSIVAAPDGRVAVSRPGPSWLATAGTGDVLSGIVGALRASGMEAFEAASGAVWLHQRSADLAGPALVADQLIEHLPHAIREAL